MKDHFDRLQDVVRDIEVDVHKFHHDNNRSAGLRVRKAMQEVKVLAQEIRKHILDKRNGNLQ